MTSRYVAEKGSDLASARIRAHTALDELWWSGLLTRSEAYMWLAKQMGMRREDCHIGMFDINQCRRAEAVCTAFDEHSVGRKAPNLGVVQPTNCATTPDNGPEPATAKADEEG